MNLVVAEYATVYVFGVGHGDCTLLEFIVNGEVNFRMLVDGGKSLPGSLVDHLEAHPRPHGFNDIDILVLTHVDFDHVGGLIELVAKGISIGEYWGPCLPAFQRLLGIFGKNRVADGIARAAELEALLGKAHVPVFYPLEGHTAHAASRKVVISVLSPAAKLVERLLSASDEYLAELLVHEPLPLEWLFGADAVDNEQPSILPAGSSLVTPEVLKGRRQPRTGLSNAEVEPRLRQVLGHRFRPDFFGNSVLNDTSLVLTVDFHIEKLHRRRVLLTGDQENWSYLAYKHPHGLGADVLKAPHHGGRVYLADKGEDAVDQLYLWLRPGTVVVSASGDYHLPRLAFRKAIQASGSSLLCPNVRTFEALSAGAVAAVGQKSCRDTFACSKGAASQREKITVVLSAQGQNADMMACVQGTGHVGLAPIRVLEQRVIEPDQSFLRWTSQEVEKYTGWIQKQLTLRHKEMVKRIQRAPLPLTAGAKVLPISWTELAQQATVDGHFNLVAAPDAVIANGVSRGVFWSGAGRSKEHLFKMPTDTELQKVLKWIGKFKYVVLRFNKDPVELAHGGSKFNAMDCADRTGLNHAIGAMFMFPTDVVNDIFIPHIWRLFCENYYAMTYCPKISTWKPETEWLVLSAKPLSGGFGVEEKSNFVKTVPAMDVSLEQGLKFVVAEPNFLVPSLLSTPDSHMSFGVKSAFALALESAALNPERDWTVLWAPL